MGSPEANSGQSQVHPSSSQEAQGTPRGPEAKLGGPPGPGLRSGSGSRSRDLRDLRDRIALPPARRPCSLPGSQNSSRARKGMWQEFSPCQTALCREARRWRARKNLQAPFFMFFSTNGHRASAPGPVGTGAPALRTTGLAVAETKAALRAPKTADRAPWVHPRSSLRPSRRPPSGNPRQPRPKGPGVPGQWRVSHPCPRGGRFGVGGGLFW